MQLKYYFDKNRTSHNKLYKKMINTNIGYYVALQSTATPNQVLSNARKTIETFRIYLSVGWDQDTDISMIGLGGWAVG